MEFASIPNDPVILLSYINTQLRDNYPSFEEFCKAQNIPEKEISDKLGAIGYHYNPTQNQFK